MKEDKRCQKILQELENIDDECEEEDIDFVKISDINIRKEYDLADIPALAFYRHQFRKIYDGDMMHEEAILEWILQLRHSTPDVIESVDRKTLQTLINSVEHLAVFFCKIITCNFSLNYIKIIYYIFFVWLIVDDESEVCKICPDVLEELETIDDDAKKYGIQFVKSKDSKLAAESGIFSFPALVYYETGVPIMYDGKNLLLKIN